MRWLIIELIEKENELFNCIVNHRTQLVLHSEFADVPPQMCYLTILQKTGVILRLNNHLGYNRYSCLAANGLKDRPLPQDETPSDNNKIFVEASKSPAMQRSTAKLYIAVLQTASWR